MSQLGCRCGNRLTKTDCPSPCSIDIFYKEEIDNAIQSDSNITLHNFLSGWDEIYACQHEFMIRPESVDYWFCPECKRVYEVQNKPQGRWLRIYQRSAPDVLTRFDEWRQIYVMPDIETDAATEENWEITLSAYLKHHSSIVCFLSPDENTACLIDRKTDKFLYCYVLEDSWFSKADV